MDDEFGPLVPPHRVRTMQVLTGALLTAVLTFFAVVVVLVAQQGNRIAPETPTLSLFACGLMLFLAPGSFVIPALIESAVKQMAAGTYIPRPGSNSLIVQLLDVRQTSLLVGLSMLEGVAFLSLIAYFVERQPFVLGVTALAVALMLIKFPTQTNVTHWVERQADYVEELVPDPRREEE